VLTRRKIIEKLMGNYLLHFDRLAEEYGLELIYNKKFHQVYEEASQELDFNQLLYRMNVVSENGSLSADEWEAASKSSPRNAARFRQFAFFFPLATFI
jgi:hypothetical protein